MRKKSTHNRRRGRRAGFFATFAALISMLVVSFGVVPAQSATVTKTGWIPLDCQLFGGAVHAHVGAALTTTLPDQVAPGATFNMVNTSTAVTFPPAAQQAGAAFNADFVQGVVSDFETTTANATSAFATTTGGNVVNSSPTQFNSVGAVQPPNQPASVVEVNGGDTTRLGFQPSTPAETLSFGDVPVDTSGGSGNAYGPAPGHGGGLTPTSGTPITLPPIGPLTVTGADGQNVTISVANGASGFAAVNTISFHDKSKPYPGTAADWSGQVAANCTVDTSASAVPSPDASFVSSFTIPIVAGQQNGVGSASARGTDPDATFGVSGNPLAAQFSAITECDADQSTRPFIVRWDTFTFKKTGTDSSSCFSSGGANVNEGTGTGTVNGTPGATVSWHFADGGGPDDAQITVTTTDSGALNIAESPPQPLNGTPGGVWVRGTLPWPAGT
jgi:hypothetical protein